MNTKRKQKIFLLINTLVWCFIGLLCWFIIGDQLTAHHYYAICFVGYPGFFLGIIGGLLYLYNHDV